MLKYRFALCNVFWNEDGIDTRYFENLTQQNTYFDNLTEGCFTPLSNYNMGDNIETIICYRDNSTRDISELIKCNYLVLQKLDENNNIVERRYYYANVRQDDGRQLIVDISLDDIQTNYFKYKTQITPCMINRTHINRFIETETADSVRFDFTPTSHLFDRETDNLPKRLTKRTKLDFNFTENSILNNWIKENVSYWLYVFCDGYHKYNVFNPTTGDSVQSPSALMINRGSYLINLQDVGCVCVPVYKTTKKMIFDMGSGKKIDILTNALNSFLSKNDNTSYLFTRKISKVPPFGFGSGEEVCELLPNGDLKLTGGISPQNNCIFLNTDGQIWVTDWDAQSGIISSINSIQVGLHNTSEPYNISSTRQLLFSKNSLKSNKNMKFEPKLLSQDFCELMLKSSDGESFSYDFSKINSVDTVSFLYDEPIQPEITKYYARLSPKGLYENGTAENYTGVVGSTDNALSVANSQYANFIANNKNFWLQSSFKMFESGLNSVMGLGTSIASGNALGALSSVYEMGIGQASNYLNRKWTIDNLKASPGSIKNASGNILFNLSVDEIGIYVEEYDALDEDKQQIYDYLYMNGYSYGHIGNIADFDHTRKYFNYLECDVQTITAPISEKEKTRLKNRLRNIRFWHNDTIQYTLENYERWLDE